jgi:DNA-binding NarL/FixJ family response regulator
MDKTSIIIVDDHVIFREGLKLLIETEGLGQVIAEADNGKEFLDLLKVFVPDVVIMDIEMPVMNGLDATKQAISENPELKIIGLTMLNDKEKCFAMREAGATGYIQKTSGKVEFENALNAVKNGKTYFYTDRQQ